MAGTIVTFSPPYLRYDKPDELSQIQDQVENLRERAYANTPKPTPVGELTATTGRTHAEDLLANPSGPVPPSTPTKQGALRDRSVQFTPMPRQPQIAVPKTAARPGVAVPQTSSPSAAKTAAPTVHVSPNAIVAMGFNCKAKFHATNNFNCMFSYWDMFFKSPTDGTFSVAGQYLGETYFPNHSAAEIDFEIDWGVYSTAAYMAPNGTATFKVSCRNVLNQINAASEEVVLNFTSPPCIDLYSVTLNENTFIGGDNGDDPTMTVVLDAPAPPGGQRIYLSLSDTSNAGILGNNYFDIPAGQKSGAISGFLGTESVLQDQTTDIHVDAGGPITGLATVYLHHKKLKVF